MNSQRDKSFVFKNQIILDKTAICVKQLLPGIFNEIIQIILDKKDYDLEFSQ